MPGKAPEGKLPMRVVVHSAPIQDRDGAGFVLDEIGGASRGSN